jgi:hypothetical protein
MLNLAEWWPVLAVVLSGRNVFGGGAIVIIALLVIYGPKYITAYAELIRARKDGRPSDDD